MDEVVWFHNLGHEQLKQIAALKLDEMKPSLLDRGITFQYDDAALEKLAQLSDDGAYSARDLQKVIRKKVEVHRRPADEPVRKPAQAAGADLRG